MLHEPTKIHLIEYVFIVAMRPQKHLTLGHEMSIDGRFSRDTITKY